MAWGRKTQIENAASVAGTELYSDKVTLNPGESSHIQVIGNSNGTTDNLVISVYATLDASSENYDTVPLFAFELDCTDGNDNDVSFIVSGVYGFRLGFVRSGSTDTITTNAYSRENGIDA